MGNTKERILLTSLKLFAANGYEGVSVSDIAGQLGITKGALYRHYKSKRDIFSSILFRMEAQDAARASEYQVPEGTPEQMPDAYQGTSLAAMREYSKAQFRYWTEDDFPSAFRRMLSIERFRSADMMRLYQQYLCSGPVDYMAALFESFAGLDAMKLAAEFYGPMYMLYSMYDGADDKSFVTALADLHIDAFMNRLEAAYCGGLTSSEA